MKKGTFILLISLIGLNAFTQIQRKAPLPSNNSNLPDSSGAKNAGKISNKKIILELDLSSEQKGKMKDIQQNYKEKKAVIMDNDSLSEKEEQEKLKELRKERATSINAILTSEQREKMKEIKKKDREKNDKLKQQMPGDEKLTP